MDALVTMTDPIRDDAEFAEVLERVNAGCDELEAAVGRRREWTWANHGLPCLWCECDRPHLHSHHKDDATIGVAIQLLPGRQGMTPNAETPAH